MTAATPTVPAPALWLGAAGLLPFAGLAAANWLAPEEWQAIADRMLTGYGAVILSFMGGCRWGFAAAGLGQGPGWIPIGVSVLPALYAWVVISLLPELANPLLAVGFVALLLADLSLTRAGGAPGWWPKLRIPLTIGAVISLGLSS